ncbi:nuclear transport factor 2 family protein, partial [Bradyrhizobium guangdongense]
MANDSKVIAANAAFYAAFSAGDFDEMQRMWADDDAISCIHPGWPAIIGRATVIGSWRDI